MMNMQKMDLTVINKISVFIQQKISNILPILLAGFISISLYQNQEKTKNSLLELKSLEEKKNLIIESIITSEVKIKAMKSAINNKNIAVAMNTFSALAAESGVELLNIKPLGEKRQGVLTVYSYELNVKSNSYNQLGDFVTSLERSDDIYFINKVNIKPAERERGMTFSVHLTLETILLNI